LEQAREYSEQDIPVGGTELACTVTKGDKVSEPKILYFDIESAGVNALKSDLGFVIIFGYKWNYEDEVKALTIEKQDLVNFDDKALLIEASKLLEEAHICVGHFSSVFDRRFIQGRLLIHGLPPIPPTKMRDTCMIARSVANFSSNRLKHLAKILELRHQKLENNWPSAWFQVMQGNMAALKGLATYCFTPDHKLLGEDLKWRSANSFKTGDTILGFDENGPHRRYRASIVEGISFAVEPIFEVHLKSGKVFRVTKEHQWLTAHRNPFGQVATFKWLTTDSLAWPERYKNGCSTVPKLLNVWEEDTSKDSGWLAGILDGEGCLRWSYRSHRQKEGLPGGLHITVGQNPGPILDRILSLSQAYLPGTKCSTTNSGRKCKTVHINGDLFKKLEFLGRLQPTRLISKLNFDFLGRVEVRNKLDDVVGVVPAGDAEIIKIQTSTGTLVVDGYPMHNCKGDVLALEELYLRLRPFDNPHPRIIGDREKCRVCGGDVEYRGKAYVGEKVYRRFVCKSPTCRRWDRERTAIG